MQIIRVQAVPVVKEVLLYRSTEEGGLGLVNVHARAMANLTRSFIQSVLTSSYMLAIFKAFVKGEEEAKQLVKKTSFFPDSMYVLIKEAYRDLKGQIFILSAKQCQSRITEEGPCHRISLSPSIPLGRTLANN